MAARRRIAERRNWPKNLYQNSKGYFWFKNPATGKGYGLGNDFKVAAAQARTANAELERRKGEVSLIQRIDGGGQSLLEWCGEYEKTQTFVNKNSANGFRSRMNAIKAAPFINQTIRKITPKEIADFVKSSMEVRGHESAARIRTELFEIFNAAIAHGLIEVGKNPVEAIIKPQRQTVTRERLTLDDFLAIRAKAAESARHRWFVNAMDLALVSGQRREDIAIMRFNQAKEGFLWVEQTKGKTKGNIVKLRIPLELRLDVAGLCLGDVIKRCRDNVVSKYMIHVQRNHGTSIAGDHLSLSTVSDAFARFRDEAKIVPPEGKTPTSFHEIRSLAARLYEEQYGEKFSQALLGHKSAEMTAHYLDSRGKEWAEIKLGA